MAFNTIFDNSAVAYFFVPPPVYGWQDHTEIMLAMRAQNGENARAL